MRVGDLEYPVPRPQLGFEELAERWREQIGVFAVWRRDEGHGRMGG
jgi:hypothetical protein